MTIVSFCSVYGARALPRIRATGHVPKTMAAPARAYRKSVTTNITSCHLQVLGTGGSELKPCVFLFTDSKRYMFNCGENVQRFSNEYRVRQSKLHDFFITKTTWDNVGGLSGQLNHFISFFDQRRRSSVKLHGPDSLTDLIQSSRFHLSSDRLYLGTNKDTEMVGTHHLPVHRDENITVHTLTLNENTSPSSPITSESEQDNNSSLASPAPKKMKRAVRGCDTISVFLCKLSDVPGKFNPQKAAKLGLPGGPKYRALVNGDSVTTPDGVVIKPSDVVGPVRIGPSFIVLECPNQGYASSITSHPLLRKESFDSMGQRLALIVHMTPRSVLDSDEYCKWMASFGKDTKHLLLHETICPPDWSLRGILNTHAPLNHLDPSVFRKFSELPVSVESTDSLKVSKCLPPECVIIGKTLLQYHLKPSQKEGVCNDNTLAPFTTHMQEVISRVKSNPDVINALGKIPEKKEAVVNPSTVPSTSPVKPTAGSCVTFLGTGASCPSKYRNVSSILLQMGSGGNVMLDCGEGTLAQLYRHFGPIEGDSVLAKLGVIFISHIHGDHNLGIISLLLKRAEILQKMSTTSSGKRRPTPTCVVGPNKVCWWLRDYSQRCQKLHYIFINCNTLTEGESAVDMNKMLTFQTVPVIHCKESYGVVISHSGDDCKIVYSGDTRPCPALVEAGRNATLLLHEATLEDGLLEEAITKKHCTISEALEIAQQMNPEFTILTHFSQRYTKILPLILSKKTELKSRVFTAFDHMTVPMSDLHRLPTLLPAIQHVMLDTREEEDTPVFWAW